MGDQVKVMLGNAGSIKWELIRKPAYPHACDGMIQPCAAGPPKLIAQTDSIRPFGDGWKDGAEDLKTVSESKVSEKVAIRNKITE